MQPIFLIGYMGSGKSTLGYALSKATGLTFIDLDNYIESRYRMTVSEIFAEKGEDGFRRIEKAMLAEVSSFEDVIVACGGGTPCFFDNMEVMNAAGTTVLLDTTIDSLHRRLCHGKAKRPLIASMTDDELRHYISEALAKRMPWYSLAQHTFPSDQLEDMKQIRHSVERFITQLGIKGTPTTHHRQ